MNYRDHMPIPDVQGLHDERSIAIDQVGIRAIRHPVRVRDRSGGVQHTVARFDMTVYLPEHFKGTHMSRFVAILNSRQGEISVDSFESLLREMVERLEAPAGRVEMRFPFFVDKAAPVSGVRSLMDYEVTLAGEIEQGVYSARMSVVVPVTSLCPCSKDISDYGAHNQRSHITISTVARDFVWIEDIVALAEAQASCEVYGLLKRADEKYVTERAYDNPKFVEDTVRDVAMALDRDPRILAYSVEAENFESIHNHSAYARIERDRRRASAVAEPGARATGQQGQ